jgi:pheromone shutdown protein TraB
MAVKSGKSKRMRNNLAQTDGSRPRVVGVVGIGHTPGIIKHWLKVRPYQVNEVMALPKSSLSSRAFWFATKISFYSLVAYGGYRVLKRPVSAFVKSL